jgi:hypothetical protein
MIMENRARRLAEPLRWGRREKTAVAALLACVVLALVGLGIYALTSGAGPRKDCIDVTFASTVGAATIHACGARAKRICGSAEFPAITQDLRSACGRAGLPFRPPR